MMKRLLFRGQSYYLDRVMEPVPYTVANSVLMCYSIEVVDASGKRFRIWWRNPSSEEKVAQEISSGVITSADKIEAID